MRARVIDLIEQGVPLKEISTQLGVNYNTVRQTSVANKLLKKFSEYLTTNQINKMKSLGNNIRALSPIKDNKDDIITIADYIYEGITRRELEEIVSDIKEINRHKNTIMYNINVELSIINERIDYLTKISNELNKKETLERLDSQFQFIRNIEDTSIKRGYLNLVAIKLENNIPGYCLGARVSLNLWNNLRRSEAIDPWNNKIIDMEKFIKLTINTIKRNNYYRDADKMRDILEIRHLTVKNQLKPLIVENNKKIEETKAKLKKTKDRIGRSGEKAIKNYFYDRELRNRYVTKQDSITHAKIQQGAAKWLYNSGYIATIELSKDKYKFDTVGYNDKEIIIMEAKANLSDLKNDKKILDYLDYCDKLYIVSHDSSICSHAKNLDKRIGVIKLNASYNFKEIIKEAIDTNNGDKSLIIDINKKNCRKFIFGY